MWGPFISSTMEHFPDAETKIVFDKLHVMKQVNEAVDFTRKEENLILLEKGVADLMGTKYIWLYSSKNLPEKYKERYNKLKKSDLLTGKACSMKENIRDLWVIHFSIDVRKDVERMKKVYLEEIMNYFVH